MRRLSRRMPHGRHYRDRRRLAFFARGAATRCTAPVAQALRPVAWRPSRGAAARCTASAAHSVSIASRALDRVRPKTGFRWSFAAFSARRPPARRRKRRIFGKKNKSVLTISVKDDTASMEIVFFNANYLEKNIKKGDRYYFFGKPYIKNGRIPFMPLTVCFMPFRNLLSSFSFLSCVACTSFSFILENNAQALMFCDN